jgi:hypothetical protein
MWFNTEVYAEQVPINEQAELAASQYLCVLNSLDRRKETITSLLGRFSQTGSSTVALLLTLEQALLEQDRERLAVLEHFLTL